LRLKNSQASPARSRCLNASPAFGERQSIVLAMRGLPPSRPRKADSGIILAQAWSR
jgi:hypothetical protein